MKSDAEILKSLALWLFTTYQNGIRLSGLIYIHRILDPRIQGSNMKNLDCFKKICGEEYFQDVVLATTFWEFVEPKTDQTREKELCTRFWRAMIEQGSSVYRARRDEESNHEILRRIAKRDRRIVLALQHELGLGSCPAEHYSRRVYTIRSGGTAKEPCEESKFIAIRDSGSISRK